LDSNGYLSEGTGENIFLTRDGVLYTPPLASSILEGITRKVTIELAKDEGYEVVEAPLLKSELYRCDEAFFTGTAAEITPILEVDDRAIGDGSAGEITSHLRQLFKEIVLGKVERYKGWLTQV
jgi:branched-chain amino acid aminotransferase